MTDKEKRDLHTETILNHIEYVKEMCQKMGIPELGEKHDLSKFNSDEFDIYKYADGNKSPHDNARDVLGYSPSWIHHKARNKHHWEYWTDFNEAIPNKDGTFTIICKAVKMPYDYVIEMVCDFVGAGKAYNKDKWTVKSPLEYWKTKCENKRAMHKDSQDLFVKIITKMADSKSLDDFVDWYSENKDKLKKEYERD